MSKKISVVLSDKDYRTIKTLAEKEEQTVSELIRDALRYGVWLEAEVLGKGKKILLKSKDDSEPVEVELIA